MEKIYVPSVLVGLDDFGTKIVSRFKDILEEKYERISIFWQSQSVNIDEVCEKVKELRGREKELKFADVPFFNFITIAEKSYPDVVYPEDVNIRKICIIKQCESNTQFDGTVYLFSQENEKREKLSDLDIEDSILYFLLILLCSNIYNVRDYEQKFFQPNKILTLGIDVICPIHIKEYLKKKFINDFFIKFNETAQVELSDNEKNGLKEKNKGWLQGNSNLKETIDLSKNFDVNTPSLAPTLPFFATAEFRKRRIQEYLKTAITNIRKYLLQKKEKAHSLRAEIEQRLMNKLENLENSRIEFLEKLVQNAPENKLGSVLKDILESDEILGISELLEEKNKNLKWAKLSNYDIFRFPENAPHPNWLVMLILLSIGLIPTIVEIVIPKIPLFSYLKWTLVFSLPFIIYTIFSVIHLLSVISKIIAEWLSKIKIIDTFFAQNFNKDFDSVHNFYEIWYLNMFRTFFRNKKPEIEEFMNALGNIMIKNKTELDELMKEIESETINELNKIEAKYDLKSIFIKYLNGEKPEDYLSKIASDFSNSNIEKAREITATSSLMKAKISKMVKEVTGEITLPKLYNPSQCSIVPRTKLWKFVFYSDPIKEFAAIKNSDIEKFEIDYPIFCGVVIVAELGAK